MNFLQLSTFFSYSKEMHYMWGLYIYIYIGASLSVYTTNIYITWCWLLQLSNTCACECVTACFQGLSWFYSEKYAKQTLLHKTRTYIQLILLFAKASQLSYSRCKTSHRFNSKLFNKDFCKLGRSRQSYIKALIWWRCASSCQLFPFLTKVYGTNRGAVHTHWVLP